MHSTIPFPDFHYFFDHTAMSIRITLGKAVLHIAMATLVMLSVIDLQHYNIPQASNQMLFCVYSEIYLINCLLNNLTNWQNLAIT